MTDPIKVELPYDRPPLSLNAQRRTLPFVWSRQVKEVRETVGWLVKARKIGPFDRVRVTMHVQPPDRRVRDSDNPVATLKAICDGLVDAGVVPDDQPRYMDKGMPVMHPAVPHHGRVWIEIESLEGE